jgi:hypothetical protein
MAYYGGNQTTAFVLGADVTRTRRPVEPLHRYVRKYNTVLVFCHQAIFSKLMSAVAGIGTISSNPMRVRPCLTRFLGRARAVISSLGRSLWKAYRVLAAAVQDPRYGGL